MSLGKLGEFLHKLGTVAETVDKLAGLAGLHETQGAAVPVPQPVPGQQLIGTGGPIMRNDVPVRNIDDRVAIIAQFAVEGRSHPLVIETARAAISKRCKTGSGGERWCTPIHDQRAEVEALFYDLRDNRTRYCSDPVGRDLYSHPRVSLITRGGDCANLVSVGCALAGAVGYQTEIVCIQEVGEDDWSHAFYRVAYISKDGMLTVMTCDPSTPNPAGWEVPDERVVRRRAWKVPG